MRFFFDTEFIDDGDTIELVSIGIVAEDGREFYAQNIDCDLSHVNEWVTAHVVPHLENYAYYEQHRLCELGRHGPIRPSPWLPRRAIAEKVQRFVASDPTFWAYYGAYDWVVLNQLYGPMVGHPSGWPFYCRDLRQALDMQGKHACMQPEESPHHALLDARWVAETWRHEVAPPGVWRG